MEDSSTQSAPGLPGQLVLILRRPAVALPLLAACIFTIYYESIFFEFVWDDFPQIVENPLLHSWTIRRIFLSDLWFHTGRDQVYYRPLFVIWSILNFKLFALKSTGWHLTTVFLHVGATCMVFWVARALKVEYWTALLATLLFGLHPIHIECAAWISAGSDSMVTIFYLLAFIAYLKARESQASNRKWQILSYIMLACALLTKEMAVTFAVIVFFYEWLTSSHELRKSRLRHSIMRAVPYTVITAGYMVLRMLVLHRATILDPYHRNLDVILTWPIALFSYLRLLIFPKGLTALYFVPYADPVGFWNFVFPLVVLLIATVILWMWSHRSRDPLISFLGLWMVVSLAPILQLRAFVTGSAVRDRYIYLGSVAFALLMAKAIRGIKENSREFFRAGMQFIIVAAICVLYGAGVWTQQVYWANSFLLFYRGYSLYPDSGTAQLNMAGALIHKQQYLPAARILNGVIQKAPTSGEAYYQLASIYIAVNKDEDARRALELAIKFDPSLLRTDLGQIAVATKYGEIGDYQAALRLYEQVLREEPDLYSAVYNCGYTYFLLERDSEAVKLLSHAAQLLPAAPSPAFYLGQIHLRTGRAELAESQLRRALELDPQGYDYHYWLGRTLAARGQVSEAITEYSEELKLHPGNPNALAGLALQKTALSR